MTPAIEAHRERGENRDCGVHRGAQEAGTSPPLASTAAPGGCDSYWFGEAIQPAIRARESSEAALPPGAMA